MQLLSKTENSPEIARNMRKIVLDIETKNTFQDIGRNDPSLLDISLLVIHDSVTDTYTSYLEEDLPKLWPILESADMLIGYNSDHFDIPLLNRYYAGDLTQIKSLDLLVEIRNVLGKRVKLDQVAEGTLGKKKSGHGLEAIEWWKAREIEKIRKYCEDDVRITKEIYDYALKNKKILYKDLGGVQPVKLDTSKWEATETAFSLNHTLPF
ncbi:MAG TPA: ribonuclease H-like domain-containing protein [Candidatus Paceibacterota bacterium]|nr:ribonuclease H-like domain-containing protein [Candidatus Paceibacterota bacterium]